ncbi:MAG: SDR family NAD(P)-dependent oxidoreductase [Streptosporangiaceae bacterium]|jgi:3alpha(or 20beta)-hydroxysteroid dehydrogenase
MSGLRDKLVIVTGAARGQGAGEVAALLEAGARVIACDVSWPALEDGQRVLDVTSEADWQSLASSLAGEPVHGLVNNAGIPLRSRLGEVSLADWNRVFAVNVTGPMLGIQALAPMMGPGSSIVNVGSLAAVTGHAAVAYTSSKWALRGLSKTASLTLGSRGIRVNLVNPGFIETPMTDAAPAVFRDANITNTPLGRAGRVEDVVPMVVFLLSPESSFISGAEIPVDGGQWAHGGAMHNYTFEAST